MSWKMRRLKSRKEPERNPGKTNLSLERGKMYKIPPSLRNGNGYIGLKRGMIAFFECLEKQGPPDGYRSGKNWHFFRIPKGAISFCFWDYVWHSEDGGGHEYGQPTFYYEVL